ncbi:hypothetical protein [Nonomuraea sp. NPDC052265]|uniref:hypothetical protein n=1 Tax=Nonomuraea sp. NPDC052265 TaxID=3364374 RepID=UPI0037CBFF3A
MSFETMGRNTGALAALIKNAIIADAIGVVELDDLPADIEPLVNLAGDKWEDADESGLDTLVAVIIILLALGAAAEAPQTPPPFPGADPRNHFPKY